MTQTTTARFAGRVALITGAASGIGRATALKFATEGARVACCDLNAEGAKATAEEIQRLGADAVALACDVSSQDDVRTTVARVIDTFEALHVLANVAGVGSFQKFEDTSFEEWQRVLAVNLNGTFHMSQAALPHLLEQSGVGNIVNVASLAGLQGQAYSVAYCVSKAGVVSLTRVMAVEFIKRGLRVNCVCPGVVQTPILKNFLPPEGADLSLIDRLSLGSRIAQPEEVAEAIAYLASDAAGSINGIALPIDSGVHVA
jgi:meso-butanediol dehydrogenase/(S,S)-butanediol dehydrogenase/diacetyl reductase